MHRSIWKQIPLLMKKDILAKKRKSALSNQDMNPHTEKRERERVIPWRRDFEEKGLDITHKVRSVICTGLA